MILICCDTSIDFMLFQFVCVCCVIWGLFGVLWKSHLCFEIYYYITAMLCVCCVEYIHMHTGYGVVSV